MIACTMCSVSPATVLDWIVVSIAGSVVLWAFVAAVRHTIAPGETDALHVKRRILLEQDEPGTWGDDRITRGGSGV